MRRSSFAPRSSSTRERVLAERAAEMRHAPTPSEARLFEALRGGRRRLPQAGAGAGEVHRGLARARNSARGQWDGQYHEQPRRADARRDRLLARAAYHVLRLPAELVMRDLRQAMERVAAEVERLRSRAG